MAIEAFQVTTPTSTDGTTIEAKGVYDQPGDLVCTKPFPCMPISFFNDPAKPPHPESKYVQSYFSEFPSQDVWYHGDYVQIDSATGGLVMMGRSDGILNPGGIRFGSSEIYAIVESISGIADTLVVGQPFPSGDDERVILFVQMASGLKLEESAKDLIRTKIRAALSARHVPSVILEVDDIPYTIKYVQTTFFSFAFFTC